MIILGIDPGATGAIAQFADGIFVSVWDMPLLDAASAKHKKRIDVKALVELVQGIMAPLSCNHESIVVYLEQGQAMPRQGVSSMFNYGRTNGLIEGILAGLGIWNIRKIVPAAWKRHLNLLGNGIPKAADLNKARQLYRHAPLGLKKHHNRADAILIGYYGCFMEGVLE